jgi:hypothetical protein
VSDGEFAALFLLTAPFAALIPAFIAQSKGRSFLGFYVYGFFFWLIALIHSLVMEPAKTRRPNFDHTALATPTNYISRKNIQLSETMFLRNSCAMKNFFQR